MWPGIDPLRLQVAPDQQLDDDFYRLRRSTTIYRRILLEVCIARAILFMYRFAFSIKIMDIIKAKTK